MIEFFTEVVALAADLDVADAVDERHHERHADQRDDVKNRRHEHRRP